MVKDEPKETIEEREIHLFVDLAEYRLHHNVGLAVGCLPNIREVVNTLGHLVNEQGRGLRVGRLDPRGEETTLVGLEEEELVEVGVGDFLHGLDVVARDELVVCVAKGG